MAKKKKKRDDFVVYSTDPDYEYENEFEEQTTLPVKDQQLKVQREKKGRGGKEATIVRGFVGSEEDLKDLAKQLKQACGVGGSAKEDEIIIQGNHADKVVEILKKAGYKTKKSGG